MCLSSYHRRSLAEKLPFVCRYITQKKSQRQTKEEKKGKTTRQLTWKCDSLCFTKCWRQPDRNRTHAIRIYIYVNTCFKYTAEIYSDATQAYSWWLRWDDWESCMHGHLPLKVKNGRSGYYRLAARACESFFFFFLLRFARTSLSSLSINGLIYPNNFCCSLHHSTTKWYNSSCQSCYYGIEFMCFCSFGINKNKKSTLMETSCLDGSPRTVYKGH
jgi:hypothetical protein